MTGSKTLPNSVLPRWDSSALLVIDVQNDFLDDGVMPVDGTQAVIPNIGALLAACRAAGRPIVHVIRLYDGDDVDLLRRELIAGGANIARPGSDGALVPHRLLDKEQRKYHPALKAGAVIQIAPREYMIFKPRWSAFFRTRLDGQLQALGVDTIIIAGCNYPNCPRATIYDGTSMDYRVVAVADAISGVTALHVDEASRVGAVVMKTHAVVKAVAKVSP
jgi:nicotinamidase-related amidase